MTEIKVLPRRVFIVWVSLVALTCATLWLGIDHPLASVSVRLASSIAILLAFVKAWFIGMDFMEIRDAPAPLKVVFNAWIMLIGGGLVILYAL
ncbi:cytochrome C oxidase subunit IV family protein [Gordonia polyisoprenivorans]|uniref:cytochrome C oxidase subunit IV family protein n=1 Tax=Gordonia polyisoprenivorans TaxID=84595 RepID=UPI001AD6218E|nr:cytochrome C oxidase subunit IV family protein [Gordonia polyisoprenivorans]QTI69059.1 cytochrome C oxidase subunit IV family protein [Gordonia polyisoprenivorans]